jgi:hypothetical protein
MIEETLLFTINNTTNGSVPVSILGNEADINDNANANTQYQWNLTGFTITNETLLVLEYNTTGSANYQLVTTTFSGTSIQGVINALNNLNLGVFFLTTSGGSTFINSYNDINSFGTLQIVNTSQPASLSYSFNMNLSSDLANIFVNAILIVSFTDPSLVSGNVPVVAGDSILFDYETSVNLKGTRVYVYNITTGVYLYDVTQLSSVSISVPFTIVANNSYLIGMTDG